MRKIKYLSLIGVCIYIAYIAITMFMWDLCWFHSRNAEMPPINWLLVGLGVAGQFLHLIILSIICKWIVSRDFPRINIIFLKKSGASLNLFALIFLALLMTVMSSRMVGHGLIHGTSAGMSVISDPCWDWAIAWHCNTCK